MSLVANKSKSTTNSNSNRNGNNSTVYLNDQLGIVERSQLMPNFFLIGVSKCATSTMAELLTKHPLITAVGGETNVGGETHLLNQQRFRPGQNENIMNTLRTDSAAKHLKLNDNYLISEIFKRGIIMEYLPSYATNDLALQNMLNSISYYNDTDHVQNKKFLMMIRNPMTRTTSSWWFKEWVSKKRVNNKRKKPSFGLRIKQGIKAEKDLQKCYLAHGFNFSEVVETRLEINHMIQQSHVLNMCSLKMLNTPGAPQQMAHVGKSLYAHILVIECAYIVELLLK